MPELPEVQTIVSDLQKILPGLKIDDVQTDWRKMFKNTSFDNFKKEAVGEKILNVRRVGKNILIGLSGDKTIIVHQKMTGHFLYGNWVYENAAPDTPDGSRGGRGKWISKNDGPIKNDPQNRFIHLIFDLSNGPPALSKSSGEASKQLALSDLRKFAKVLLWPTGKLSELEDINNLGPDPTAEDFDFNKFQKRLYSPPRLSPRFGEAGGEASKKAAKGEPRQRRGKIKTVLMDQSVIAGIGNIYSDEILWLAGINPLKPVSSLTKKELESIFNSTKKILKKAIEARGTSDSDYRDPSGKKGKYQEMLYVYGLEGEKCQKKDGGTITRLKISGRSAHFCPVHQKI